MNGQWRDANGRLRDANGRFAALSQSATQASNSIDGLNRNSTTLFGNLRNLHTLIAGSFFAGIAISVGKTADEMQNLNSQIKLVTANNEQYLAVQSRLKEMADKNLNDISATIDLYTNSARALSNMGKSQNEVLKFTNAISLAMGVGGKSAQEQAAALRQLGQAMQSGVLRGDEFNSIAENAPILLELVSKSLNKTRGEIREMAADGKITAEVVYNAVSNATEQLQKQFDSMPVTMSQAFTVAKNKYKEFTDEVMNGTGGISQTVAGLILGIAKNFDTLAKVTLVGVGLAFIQLAGTINVAAKAMAAFNLITKANPLILIVSTILAVSSAFYGLDDVVNTTTVIMGDLINMIKDGWSGIFSLIGDGVDWMSGKVSDSNADMTKSYTDMFSTVTTQQDAFYANASFASNNLVKLIGTNNLKNEQSFFGFYEKSQKGFLGFVEVIGTGVIAAISTLGGFFKFVFTGIENTLNRMGNAMVTAQEWIDKKLGKAPTKYQRYEVNDLSAQQAFADVNTAGQRAWHDVIMGWANKLNSNQLAVNGMPPSMDYKSPVQTSSSDSDTKDKKKKDDLQIQVFNAWKNAGLSAQQAMLLTAEVGRENAYNAKVLFGYHKDANNGKLNVGMLSWQGSRATDLSKYLAAAGVLKNSKIEKSQESLNAMAQFAVKEMMSNPAYAKTKTVFLANKEIDTNTGFNVLGRDYIRWDMDGRKINANTHKARRNNYYTQIQAKVGDKDLVSNFMEQTKAHDDYVNSIATGEAKIRAELAKTIESLPKKGFSGQALEDEKKRLTEEARFDIDLFRETNRQKLDELMAVHKTKKDQILDESYLQGLTIAADESKSREQRKTELEALDVGTKEKIRLNDIANKHELNQIYAYRKTSSELIADEWDEKIDALRQYTGEYKEEWRKAYEEQKQLALDIDKLNYQQQLLDLQKFNMADIAYFEQTLKIKNDLVDKSNATQAMKDAQRAANEYENWSNVGNTTKGIGDKYFGQMSKMYGQDNPFENISQYQEQNKIIQDMRDADLISHEQYLSDLAALDADYANKKTVLLMNKDAALYGGLLDLMKGFVGENSKTYRVMFAIQKGWALATSIIDNQVALGKAWSSAPFPYNLPAILSTASQTGVIQAAIAAVSPKGFSTGGYTGNMGVNDIAGVVHGKEYVLNAAATKRIGVDNLNAMNRGAGVGTKVIVNNYSNENATVEKQDNGDIMVTIGKMINDVTDYKIEKCFAKASRQGWNIGR